MTMAFHISGVFLGWDREGWLTYHQSITIRQFLGMPMFERKIPKMLRPRSRPLPISLSTKLCVTDVPLPLTPFLFVFSSALPTSQTS